MQCILMPEEVQAWSSFSVPLTLGRHLMLRPEFIYKGLAKVGLQQESCSCLQALQRSELKPSTSCSVSDSSSLLEITLSAHKTHIFIYFPLFCFVLLLLLLFFLVVYGNIFTCFLPLAQLCLHTSETVHNVLFCDFQRY